MKKVLLLVKTFHSHDAYKFSEINKQLSVKQFQLDRYFKMEQLS